MKHFTIYYFSGTGNTWWFSNALKAQLELHSITVNLHSIETLGVSDIKEHLLVSNHILFGFPAYGSTAPYPMLDFIKHFPQAPLHMPVSIFVTQALASGDTGLSVGQLLIDKGYTLFQTKHFKMMNNLHLPSYRFYKPRNDFKLTQMLNKSQNDAKIFANELTGTRKKLRGNHPFAHLLGNIQRSHIDSMIKNTSEEFEVDMTRCVQCNTCANICPTSNIKFHNEQYHFGKNCALCLRCYSQCPTNAILIGKDSSDVAKFPRYKGPTGFLPNKLIKKT